MSDFNKDDVLKVARAMLLTHTKFNDDDNSSHSEYECLHCYGESIPVDWSKSVDEENYLVKHKPDCPVLVAQDLLS